MAKFYFYYSAMNAGKSTTLLQSAHNYRERGMNPLLLTPALDHRDGKNTISSRIGLSSPATPFNNQDNLFDLVAAKQNNKIIHCVLVDEAQFLTQQQVWQLSDVADELHIPVLAYGIRTDFRAEVFPGSAALLAVVDNLIEIKTICHCGRKATHTLRVDQYMQVLTDGKQVHIGGNEQYISVCRKHFKSKEAAA